MKFIVNIERDETGMMVAECPAIPGCVSQGRTGQEALDNIREAIEACLEARAANGMPYVSRGGVKLAAALDAFGIDPAGWVCADLGSNVGGFVDCLLQRGAGRVYAIDTGYGALAWALRTDPRVVVMERTNAMHATLPEPVDLVTIDVAWTPQHRILPNAIKMLRPGGRIITLIKPHYEADEKQLRRGVLDPELARQSLDAIHGRITAAGAAVEQLIESPIPGQKGNIEFLALLSPESTDQRGNERG